MAIRLFCLFLILVPPLARAHDIWLEKRGHTLVLLKGHEYSTHGGAKEIPYAPEEVLRAVCFDSNGEPRVVKTKVTYPFEIQRDCAASYVLTSSGYWSKTPFGTKNIAKDRAKQALRSWLSYESVKRLDAWNKTLALPLTDDLELTPTNNPLALSEGKKVRLLVTRNGRRVAGALVSYGGETRGQSDSEGRINIRIRRGGMQLIQASFTEAADGQKADEVVHSTTLVFELGAEP
jgi:nickel transport protein